jgi:hypothetical protein
LPNQASSQGSSTENYPPHHVRGERLSIRLNKVECCEAGVIMGSPPTSVSLLVYHIPFFSICLTAHIVFLICLLVADADLCLECR